MGDAIDHLGAGSTDPLAAIMVEGDGILAASDELFVDLIEHLEKGLVGTHILCFVSLQFAGVIGTFLAPDKEGEVHYL
jgi:hypothetical protein